MNAKRRLECCLLSHPDNGPFGGDDGRLASRRLYQTSGGTNLSYLAYGYDADDNITAIRDQLNDTNSLYYGYDANGRLKLTSLVAGSPAAASESYSYATGTNRLSSVVNASGTRSISYDGRGNTASESRPGSVSATTGYDGYGRLTSYSRTDVGSLSFVYNGQDDRVAMTSGTGTRRFIYDGQGRVLGEYGVSAADVHAEYIWALPQVANDNGPFGGDGVGGYAPLAVATPDSGGTVQLNWVHGNHLGVPLVTTDASGNAATTPNDYLAPGFPGQSRTIADLYYNRYRDYDPSTGRYVQADPIGLAGGANSYVYAENNPITLVDPLGLTSLRYNAGSGVLYVNPERKGWAPYSLPASSGRPECGCSEAAKDMGPIPVGRYEIQTNEISGGFFKNVYRYGIERQDWGDWRVPLHFRPGTNTHRRSGFFLHGGSWPGSAGCIDVGGGFWGSPATNRLLFDLQNDPDGRVPPRVIRTVVP